MKDASIQRILNDNEGCKPLPAILVVQPGEDKNVPQTMTFALLESYQKAGGTADYLFYPEMPHGFGHQPSSSTDDLILAMRDFINRQLRK
jgi:dipeptidyl aminopeptidase/acylaminoacyl peptidase